MPLHNLPCFSSIKHQRFLVLYSWWVVYGAPLAFGELINLICCLDERLRAYISYVRDILSGTLSLVTETGRRPSVFMHTSTPLDCLVFLVPSIYSDVQLYIPYLSLERLFHRTAHLFTKHHAVGVPSAQVKKHRAVIRAGLSYYIHVRHEYMKVRK